MPTVRYSGILILDVLVRPSLEPGWLEGNLEGKVGSFQLFSFALVWFSPFQVGLVPENYVEFLSWLRGVSSRWPKCQEKYQRFEVFKTEFSSEISELSNRSAPIFWALSPEEKMDVVQNSSSWKPVINFRKLPTKALSVQSWRFVLSSNLWPAFALLGAGLVIGSESHQPCRSFKILFHL